MMKERKEKTWRLRFVRREIPLLIFFILVSLFIAPMVLVLVNFILTYDTSNPDQGMANYDTVIHFLLHPVLAIQTCLLNEYARQAYFAIQGVFILWFLIRSSRILIRSRKHILEDASKYGAHGTARFAKPREVFDRKNFVSKISDNKFGTIMGEISNKEVIRKSNSKINGHVMVVAGSGSGKSEGFAIPNIIRNKTHSVICSDGKLQLYRRTSKQKAKEGFKIIVVDFVKFIGNKWNPLNKMEPEDVDTFSTKLVQSTQKQEDMWTNHGINYISACIMYVLENYSPDRQHMGSVRDLSNLAEEDLKECFERLPSDSIAKDYFSEVSEITGQTWVGVVTTAKAALRFWKSKRIREFTQQSDFEFTDLGTEKIALYIRIHPTNRTYRALINTFFNQLFSELIDGADKFGGKYPLEIDFMLDEFANIGEVEDFQNVISYTRSLGLNISAIVQDIAQLIDIYGEMKTRSIISNCDSFLFMGTNDGKTAEDVSTRLGSTTKRVRNDNEKQEKMDGDSLGYNYIKRSLMNVDEIMGLDDEYALLKVKGKRPIKIEKVFAYEKYPEYNDESEMGWHLSA
ncbi:type IV secretory system conjugative DNA transfer family protein [Listeria booriae]|uniref:VirD4-like conjugal transfer protein, CD1115 family n=1 Tax=Listeria booriae TaxID=1552123 RepID=UPI001629200B|nr:type IV secretory system conjugative DNA transfer family protein [Listeria booriae]MBC1920469.1 type IV secretory system conjugative DNA transfer family protein [Listeria booriae]